MEDFLVGLATTPTLRTSNDVVGFCNEHAGILDNNDSVANFWKKFDNLSYGKNKKSKNEQKNESEDYKMYKKLLIVYILLFSYLSFL